MKPPPLLLGAGLLFWGFETGWLATSIMMAALLEAAHWTQSRWEFSDADLNRIWDLCVVLIVGALLIRYTSEEQNAASAYQFFQWFPLLFFPLVLAQLYGNRDRIPATVYSWILRWRPSKPARPVTAFHVGYLFFGACLISAGAANRRDPWFFIGLSILCGWALWGHRSRRFTGPVWAASFGAAVLLAFYGQMGLHQLQDLLEGRVSAWAARWMRRGFDANESRTELGSIGNRKQSGRILLRVRSGTGAPPELLRQGSYDSFRETVWLAARNQFASVPSEADATTWLFQPRTRTENSFTLFTSMPRPEAILPLPLGSERLENLPAGSLETNLLDAVRVREAPGFVGCGVQYHDERSFDLPPDRTVDLQIPNKERPALEQIVRDLRLEAMNDPEKIETLKSYFQENFAYRLFVPENLHHPTDSNTPLSRFLLRSRKGHCEYFATATVLLLRAAGVPARYVTGYSVQETPDHGSTYVVRERHAHAWTLVWEHGRWKNLDTTPAAWISVENERASAWQWLADLWSEGRFQFLKWRWLGRRDWLQQAAPWLLAPLALLLSWRLFVRRKRARRDSASEDRSVGFRPGADSEFYEIEKQLTATLGERPPGQSLMHWIESGPARNWIGRERPEIDTLLLLHYRHRFDPIGLPDADREALRSGANLWVERRRNGPEEMNRTG